MRMKNEELRMEGGRGWRAVGGGRGAVRGRVEVERRAHNLFEFVVEWR